jgi:hypothetical protein
MAWFSMQRGSARENEQGSIGFVVGLVGTEEEEEDEEEEEEEAEEEDGEEETASSTP